MKRNTAVVRELKPEGKKWGRSTVTFSVPPFLSSASSSHCPLSSAFEKGVQMMAPREQKKAKKGRKEARKFQKDNQNT